MKNIKTITQNKDILICAGVKEMDRQSGGDNVRGVEIRLPVFNRRKGNPTVTSSFHCREDPNLKFVFDEMNVNDLQGYTQFTIYAKSPTGTPADPRLYTFDCHYIIIGKSGMPQF